VEVRERASAKRDRAGRYYRELRFLEERGDQGARPEEIAAAIGMSRRTVYRDLQALQEEMEVPLWSDEGRWGVSEKGFLPPLKLTLAEAMAVFLSARLMARFADEYDPDLAGAFQKVAVGLPPVLAEHVARTLEVMARRPLDERMRGHVRLLTQAWADRRVVHLTYDPAAYDPGRLPREARVHPYLIEPSSTTHALYLIGFDEARGAVRTFKIERILSVEPTTQTFDAPEVGAIEQAGRAWDIIADQAEVEVVLRFAPSVASRVAEATWHPSQRLERQTDGSLVWRATVPGTVEIRFWILSWGPDVEVLSPPGLREEIAERLRAAARTYS
jgi:predicted DNA-binding transcriptional regulator YafY